jgi:hypothetical protein
MPPLATAFVGDEAALCSLAPVPALRLIATNTAALASSPGLKYILIYRYTTQHISKIFGPRCVHLEMYYIKAHLFYILRCAHLEM